MSFRQPLNSCTPFLCDPGCRLLSYLLWGVFGVYFRSSNIVSHVLGTLGCTSSDKSRKDFNLDTSSSQSSMIHVPADNSAPAFDVIAVIEPLSRAAQKILPILLVSIKYLFFSDSVFNQQIQAYIWLLIGW